MTRKHFEAVAAIINKNRQTGMIPSLANVHIMAVDAVARDLAGMFEDANPRFDRDKFLTACGL